MQSPHQTEPSAPFIIRLNPAAAMFVVGVHLAFALLHTFFAWWVALTPGRDRELTIGAQGKINR